MRLLTRCPPLRNARRHGEGRITWASLYPEVEAAWEKAERGILEHPRLSDAYHRSDSISSDREPAERRDAPHPMTVAQVEALLRDHAGADAAMLAELIADSGARPQDALAVPHRHVGRSTIVYADKNVDGAVVPGSKTGLEKIRSVGLLRNLRARRTAAGNPRRRRAHRRAD